jgi:hypothetical protein
MAIDPVVVLSEELRDAENTLHAACRDNPDALRGKSGEEICALTARIREISSEIFETRPTSALGAGILVRMAAERLPFSYGSYTKHFHEIAERLGAGQRELADIIWLRAMRTALTGGLCGKDGVRIAPLLRLAIEGARQPIVVFRAVTYAREAAQSDMDAAIH